MSEKPHILLVDDDEVTSETVLMLLKRYSLEAIHATTLADGTRLSKQPLDVIALNPHLPDGSGIDLFEALRMAGSTTRVILLTGSKDVALERKVRRLTPEAVVHKPLDFFEVFEATRGDETEQGAVAA